MKNDQTTIKCSRRHIFDIPLKAVYVIAFLMLTVPVLGQKLTVNGVVKDELGAPLPGASVAIKGTVQGTATNLDGAYTISGLLATDILVFSFIGTKPMEVTVGSQTEINIILQYDYQTLEEAVIVGYGTQTQKAVTGAIAVVDDEIMDGRPNTQLGALLQGKAAGVQILSNSGKPSQGLNIRIRGTNSINAGSEPLYVVDGVPTNDTRSINPADVASISILKDASSAAIYGAQGANGVVLITTKSGNAEKTAINFNTYTGFSEVWKTLDVLSKRDYRRLMEEMGQNTNWDLYQENTNWQDEIFQSGLSQNYQLSVSGKNANTNYYLSGGWTKQVGAVRSAEMSRANIKVNLEHEISDRLTIGSRSAYTVYSDVDVADNQNVNSGGVLLGALSTPPIIGVFNEDGSFTSNPFQNWENPIASTDGSERQYRNQRLIGNVYLEAEIVEGLHFRSSLGIDHSNGVYDYFLDPYLTSYGRALNGRAVLNSDKSSYYIFDNTLRYEKAFQKNKIEALVGTVSQKFLWENSGITTQNFASNSIKTVNAGSEIINASASKSEKANQAFIGRLNYSYDDKYLFTMNLRADGSSVFGPKNRWGYFPSFSTGWRISDEDFFPKGKVVSNIKVRAGWGIVGNDQIGNNYAYLGLVGGNANYPIGGAVQPGTYPASISNETLKWEQSTQTNFGLDIGLLKDRVGITIDAYIKQTTDLLLNAPLPRSTGFDNAIQNIGALENRGIELSINSVNIDGKLKWSTDFNIAANRNKVIDLVGQEIFAGGIAGRGEASLVKEGEPLGTIFGYRYGGADPTTGDAYYITANGESTFTPSPEDRTIIGNANPDFFFGLTNNLSYKGFGLSIFLQGAVGSDMLNATKIELEGMTDPKNQSVAVLDRWQQPGDITNIPRASWGNVDNSRISTRFVEDASYMRLKTLTLSYTLSPDLKVLDQIGISALRLYITGENLLTFTKYSGFDPEVNAFGASNIAQGIDFGTYPQTRNIIFGLNLTF